MGYRSHGYFVIPIKYAAELERRVLNYLKEEEERRISDKAKADKAGKHYMYGSTKPWNPLEGFDNITLMSDSAGNQYYKYAIEGWKWYQGSDFPLVVSDLLNDIEEDSQLAIFVLQGEDWDDTTVVDTTGQINVVYGLDGNPWSEEIPQIFAMVHHDGPAKYADNYQEVLDKLTALEPTESGMMANYGVMTTKSLMDKHDNASTTIYTPEYTGMAINAPTLKKMWTTRSEMFFYWDRDNTVLYHDIIGILEGFSKDWEGFGEGAIGFVVKMNEQGHEDHSINATEIYEYDVYPNSGWDESTLDLTEIKEIPTKDIHKI